ncbi:MAG: PAS domain S-box protein [Myxococcota bacterium]
MEGTKPREPVEPLFEAITAHSTDSIMLLDPSARIRFINRTAPGLTIDQVLGTQVYDYVPPDQHEDMRRCFARVLETGKADRYENIYEVSKGVLTRWESRVGPLEQNGEITGFVVFANDVTERDRAIENHDRLFKLSRDLLCIVDYEGHFVSVNPAFIETLGYSEEELRNRPFMEFVHPDDREATEQVYAQAQGSDVIAYENRYLRKDGSTLRLQWVSTPDALTNRFISIARDVTVERELEQQLRQSQKMDAVGQLAGGVAHDFNNLMQAVLGNVHFARSSESDAELQTYLDEIEAAADRATQLTKQLLTFSRRRTLEKSRVDLNELVRDLTKLLRRVIPENIAMDFIAGHDVANVDVDRTQLEQVVMNLCLNARDAMRTGGKITIETENVLIDGAFVEVHPWAKPGRYVLVSVTDTGTGISPEVRERIFEPFYTTKAPGEGTGLGLAVVYGIVEQHGGLVHVYSELGQGTAFKIYLPVTLRPASKVGTKLGPRAQGGAETVLVAEDEELVRRVVVHVLKRAGYRVLSADSGTRALELFRENRDIDLVLLDVVMPDISGPETYERIAKECPALPVIFSSGYSDPSRFTHAIPEGRPLVEKPYKPETILAEVRRVLDSK